MTKKTESELSLKKLLRPNDPKKPAPPSEQRPSAKKKRAGSVEGQSLLDYTIKDRRRVPHKYRKEKSFVRKIRRVAADREWVATMERFRDAVIRASLARREGNEGVLVALTGVRGGEGTSLISLLLSLALGAQMRHRVAFLDGRFNTQRFDTLSYTLALSKNACQVEKGANFLSGYYNEAHPNIYFLKNSSGEPSLEFFSDKELRNCFAHVRRLFDFTVIDVPPLLTESSNTFIAPQADLVYLVVTAGKTRLADVDRCADVMAEAGAKITGVVINGQKAPVWSNLFWRDYFF